MACRSPSSTGRPPGRSTRWSSGPLAWLNASSDDIVAEREHLPPLADQARQLAVIVDAYGLAAGQRRGFLNQIIEFAICDTAWEADDAAITPEATAHPIALWAMAGAPDLRPG